MSSRAENHFFTGYTTAPEKLNPKELEGQKAEKGRSEVILTENKAYKISEYKIEEIIHNLNMLEDSEVSYPHHFIYSAESTDCETVIQMPKGTPLDKMGEEALEYIDKIRETCFKAAEQGYRLDARPGNWAKMPSGKIAYIDTLDASSIKESSNPEQWVAKFIENGTEKLEDELNQKVVEEFYELSDEFRNEARA